ncbi:MAG: prephenate dehydratase [Opitutales bacterium]|nr:prephenate dehydratase [Opitutales bacterium]
MKNQTLESLRDEIDKIDTQVVCLLNHRVRTAAEIGKIKNSMGVEPYDPAREEQVFAKIKNLSEGPMREDSLKTIYREVISASIALEKEMVIGYLGPEATYTHQAAVKNFGSTLEYRPLSDIPDVFNAVESGECDYGVVPIENSTEGAVNRSLDLLVESELSIIAQVYLQVEHCLFSQDKFTEIKEIQSKDQALAQCGEWIRRNFPHVSLIPVTSTAEGVKNCKIGNGVAAIAGELAGRIHGVPMLEQGIQDKKNNVTRFLVVARNSISHSQNVKYRTSLVVTLTDQVGALQSALSPFSSRDINLCKIESRPSRKKSWDYYFFIDFIGHAEEEEIKMALSELEANCSFYRILGSYPENSPE